jgi:hypothetical protein
MNKQGIVGLLNTSIMTTTGIYKLENLTLEEAYDLVHFGPVESAIGHSGTAQVMTELLGLQVDVNRIEFAQEVGQQAIVFKLNKRLPEGKILTLEEIKEIGFKFQLMTRIE